MKNSKSIDASRDRQGDGLSSLTTGPKAGLNKAGLKKAGLNKAFALRVVLALCLTSALQFAPPARARQAPAAGPQAAAAAPARRSDEMVAARDGVKLATSIYLPEGNGPWPVVLIRTPYNKELQAVGHATWTRRGFALVVQDCRGKFKSE
ncbi:MAG TPA: CocE/NonD family hydrolase, partial [Blastocatellia bacterium]|nr:CocE/NonD family hydrolase [Blastocatellia bacterium]